MTIKNFDVQITMVDGTPILDGNNPVILKDIIAEMLCGNYQDEANTLSGLDKFKRGELALKVKKAVDTNFETEELSIIKDIVGKRGTVPVVHQSFKILDGE